MSPQRIQRKLRALRRELDQHPQTDSVQDAIKYLGAASHHLTQEIDHRACGQYWRGLLPSRANAGLLLAAVVFMLAMSFVSLLFIWI